MVDFRADDTDELRAWRAEVRDFLATNWSGKKVFDYDYSENESDWAEYLQFWKKVAAKGWVGLTWPKEYYGLGRPAIEKWILDEEFITWGAPSYPVIGLSVAAAILRHGTDAQRRKHLKGIADATVLWGEGYSEPSAGSDLANLTTRAHRDGNDWVLNGQKAYGTAVHLCHWMIVLARTGEGGRHKGISCFLVPLDAPGIQMLPSQNIAEGQQNDTFFENVRLPADALLGTENEAWTEIWFRMGGDLLDRAGPLADAHTFRIIRMLNLMLRYCRETRRGSGFLIDDPIVEQTMGELVSGVEAIKLMAYEGYSDAMAPGAPGRSVMQAHILQGYYKEFWPHMAQSFMEIAGPLAQLQDGKWAQLGGEIQHYFRASFGNHAGGTSQLKRMTMATRGLGLPR